MPTHAIKVHRHVNTHTHIHTGLKLHPHSTPAAVAKDDGTGRLSLSLASGETHPDFDVVLMVRSGIRCW